MTVLGDGWEGGTAYDYFMGRWSMRLAPVFVRWLGVEHGARWLDIGTGTGALVENILREADPRSVDACDASAAFLDVARSRIEDPRVEFMVADADKELPRATDGYDAVVSSLALNFFPAPERSVREQADRVRPEGLVGACVWDYREGMEFLRYFWDAAVRISPGASSLDEGGRFPVCDPNVLRDLWQDAGLTDIRVEPLTVPTGFSGFEDYWTPFLGAAGPAPSFVASLSDVERRSLEAELRSSLPVDADGGIPLKARAWAVAGRRPARSEE